MSLGIIFNDFQATTRGNITDAVGVGTIPVKVHQHNGTGARSDSRLNEAVVDLHSADSRLHKHRAQAIVGDGENRSNIGVGRHNHLIAIGEHPQLFPRTQSEIEGIKPIAAGDAVARTNVGGILLLEAAHLLTEQIPATLNHTLHSLGNLLAVHRGDSLQIEILNHFPWRDFCGIQ